MIATKFNDNIPLNNANALCHLTKQRNHPFPPINIKYTSTFEVENIIRSLKKKRIPVAMMEYRQRY